MDILAVLHTVISIELGVAVFLLVIRPYILVRHAFKCKRCGRCCRLKLRLYPEDVKQLAKGGYRKKYFLAGKYMRRINGYCVFLTLDEGVASCKINCLKPRICRIYPIHKDWLLPKCADLRCSFYRRKLF